MILINEIFKPYISSPKLKEYLEAIKYEGTISKEQAIDDLQTLRYLMENRYCGWEYYENNGIEWDRCFQEIETFILAQREINITDFCKSIHHAFDAGVVDNHLSFCSPMTGRLSYSRQFSAYFSDFKAEQKDGAFYAVESACPNVSDGDLIKADDHLFPTFYHRFLIGVRSFEPVSEMTITVNDRPVSVPLHRCKAIRETEPQDVCLRHDVKNGIDVIRSNCCDYVGDITEKTDFVKAGKQFRDKEILVLNYLSNEGGYNRITREFIKGLNHYSHCQEHSIQLRSPVTEGKSCFRQWVALSEAEPYDHTKAKFDGKLVMLVNGDTASAGETAVLYARSCRDYLLIGENTMGCNTFGNVASYELPNSRIICRIPNTINLCADPDDCREGYGFTPDYWVDSDDVEGEVIEWIKKI